MNEETGEKDEEVGALWRKTNARGAEFFAVSVRIGGVETSVVVFPNRKKKTDAHPDLRVLRARKKARP